MHVQVLLSEDICNWSPSFCAFVPQEETPSPLPVCFPTDVLPELPQEHSVVKIWGHGIILFLASESGSTLTGIPFRFSFPH